ncbi:phosphotransferase family protein [Halogranum rubrum]|uniref:Aminoglycoside phosphotransferase domain-containing protein n=1 Tax=Halogranum salarium B-1 TaxID=1210908 RepID=J2ZW97_9EURY|nr:aminoglycoside phosphotransferase family protein [Halogranum salarium]EJN57303.1 hypothetical protein HSB1_42660 [Halogranum salarium B-1]
MDDIPDARAIPQPVLEQMIREIEPNLELYDATPAERGFCTVYRVLVSRNGESEVNYVKASPDDNDWGISAEARIQAVLSELTSIPVPDVFGVTDDHEFLPAPYYLMSALPGDEENYESVSRIESNVLRRLAREIGMYLGELHGVQAVDRFGHVQYDGPRSPGERPDGDPASLTTTDGGEPWPVFLRSYMDRELDRHEESKFSNLTSELTRSLRTAIEGLEKPFTPVLGRNDHGLHNLLLDSDTGEVTGMLDWAYTLAVPPAFDFEFAVYLFSGAFLAGLPDVQDRRPLVREAMLSGYGTTAPDRLNHVSDPEPLYEALAMVRIMNDFHHLEIPTGQEDDVADRIEADARTLLNLNNPR